MRTLKPRQMCYGGAQKNRHIQVWTLWWTFFLFPVTCPFARASYSRWSKKQKKAICESTVLCTRLNSNLVKLARYVAVWHKYIIKKMRNVRGCPDSDVLYSFRFTSTQKFSSERALRLSGILCLEVSEFWLISCTTRLQSGLVFVNRKSCGAWTLYVYMCIWSRLLCLQIKSATLICNT